MKSFGEGRYILALFANGAVQIREKGQTVIGPIGLAIIACDELEALNAIKIRFCRLARDGSGTYYWNDFEQDSLKALKAASKLAQEFFATHWTKADKES
jgi:hypothetical protein